MKVFIWSIYLLRDKDFVPGCGVEISSVEEAIKKAEALLQDTTGKGEGDETWEIMWNVRSHVDHWKPSYIKYTHSDLIDHLKKDGKVILENINSNNIKRRGRGKNIRYIYHTGGQVRIIEKKKALADAEETSQSLQAFANRMEKVYGAPAQLTTLSGQVVKSQTKKKKRKI